MNAALTQGECSVNTEWTQCARRPRSVWTLRGRRANTGQARSRHSLPDSERRLDAEQTRIERRPDTHWPGSASRWLMALSESKADPGQCVSGLRSIRVWSASSLLHCQAANVCCALSIVFALRPRSVHTERSRRALCVHSVLTLRQPWVNAAFTLCPLWIFLKWATLNAVCTQR